MFDQEIKWEDAFAVPAGWRIAYGTERVLRQLGRLSRIVHGLSAVRNVAEIAFFGSILLTVGVPIMIIALVANNPDLGDDRRS